MIAPIGFSTTAGASYEVICTVQDGHIHVVRVFHSTPGTATAILADVIDLYGPPPVSFPPGDDFPDECFAELPPRSPWWPDAGSRPGWVAVRWARPRLDPPTARARSPPHLLPCYHF